MLKTFELIKDLCPNGVEFIKLKDVAEVLNGYAFKSKQYVDKGIRVIRISDVQKGRISDKDVKYYPEASKKEIERYMLNDGDIVVSLTGDVGRVAQIQDVHLPAGLNQRVACLRGHTGKVLNRYLFHLLDQVSFESDAIQAGRGSAQKNLSTVWLGNYLVPIPPIEVQAEIVRILDSFTELTAELTAELAARKKQYEFYREDLLGFEGRTDVEWKKLGAVVKIETGRLNANEAVEGGKYMFFTTAAEPSRIDKYRWDTEALLIAGNANVGAVQYYKGKFEAYQRTYVITEVTEELDIKFLYYVLRNSLVSHLSNKSKKAAMTYIVLGDLQNFTLPLPPLPVQHQIVEILDSFTELIAELTAEIELRQKQYEFYREKLLTF